MKRFVTAVVVGASLLMSANTWATTEASKLGIVDVSHILQSSEESKTIARSLEDEFKDQQSQVREAEKAFLEARKEYESEGEIVSDDEREALESSAMTKAEAFQRLQFEFNEAVSRRHQDEMQRFMSHLRSVIDDYAQAQDYDIIIPSELSLYFRQAVDVTNEIIEKLDSAPKEDAKG